MIKYFYDRCEKEISEYDHEVNKFIFYTDTMAFCDDCMKDFDRFITNRTIIKPCDTLASDK